MKKKITSQSIINWAMANPDKPITQLPKFLDEFMCNHPTKEVRELYLTRKKIDETLADLKERLDSIPTTKSKKQFASKAKKPIQ